MLPFLVIGVAVAGVALGWVLGRKSAPTLSAEDRARAEALEAERVRLAVALNDTETSLHDAANAQESAQAAADQNRRLLRRVRDLETALRDANRRSSPPTEELEVALAMANRERDAAQAALMQLQGSRTAEDVSHPPDGAFDDLPPLGD